MECPDGTAMHRRGPLSLRLLVVAAAIAVACSGAGRGAEVSGVVEWLDRLTDESEATRAEAARRLSEAGMSAAEPLRAWLGRASPKAAAKAARIWTRVQWEGVEAEALAGSFAVPEVRRSWESFIARRGAEAVHAVAAMRHVAGHQEGAVRALGLLLSAVPAADLAAAIAAPGREALLPDVRTLLAFGADRLPDPSILARIGEVMLLLWWYDDVPPVAARAYGMVRDDVYVALAASAIRRGGMDGAAAEAVRRLAGSFPRPEWGAEIVFWTLVARRTDAIDSLRGVLRPADVGRLTPDDAATLAEAHRAGGQADEVDRLLDGAGSAAHVYLRARLGTRAEIPADLSAGISEAIERLDRGASFSPAEAFSLAELMERFGDGGPAERIWRQLIERPPENSVFSANARLRLARRAEARGDLREALRLCEEALSISGALGAESTVTGPGGARGTEWLMRVILELRRKIDVESRNGR